MSNTVAGVRGAGVNRSGATDTTMLIWKVIDANPGITREEIFAKVEHEIPAGWAKRLYINANKIRVDGTSAARILERARRHAFMQTLAHMRKYGSVAQSAEGNYRILRPIKQYNGNPDQVDATGDQAANHLNEAYAWRTLQAARKRFNPDSPRLCLSRAEARAFALIMDARRPADD